MKLLWNPLRDITNIANMSFGREDPGTINSKPRKFSLDASRMGMMASDPEDHFSRTAVRVGFYDVEKTIGKGNFAVVKLARHRITKSTVAIKIIDKTRLDENSLVKLHREVQIMKLLRHPHILKLYQVMETQNMMYIVTEYAPNGEMFARIDKKGKLSEDEARRIFWQIITAVEYCHKRHVVHRDLKTENLLLDENMNIKIADFGFGNISQKDEMMKTFCGSPPYAAPEIFEAKEYLGPAVDVWSLGVVLYVLVCAALPFDGASVQEVRDRVLEGRFRVPYFMSAELEDLIRRVLVKNPSQRYTIEQIKQHAWMQADRGYAFQAEINKDVNIDLSMETGIDGDLNAQVLTLMQSLGIEAERTKKSVMEKTYDHHCAIYYLLAERLKQHRTSFPQQRRYGTRLRRASVVADKVIVQNGIVQSVSGQHGSAKIQPIPRPLPYAPLQHALHELHIGDVPTPSDMESQIAGCGREIVQPMLQPQQTVSRHSPSQLFTSTIAEVENENEDSEERGNTEPPPEPKRRSRRTGIMPQPTGMRRATAPVPSEGTLFVPANHPLLRVQNDHEKPEEMRVAPGLENSYLPNGMRIQIVAPEQMSTSMMSMHPQGQLSMITKPSSPSTSYAFSEGRRASDGNSTNGPFVHLLRKAENEQNALQKLYKRSLTPEEIYKQQLQHNMFTNCSDLQNSQLTSTTVDHHLQVRTNNPHFQQVPQFSNLFHSEDQQLQQTLNPFYGLEQQQHVSNPFYAEFQSKPHHSDLMDIHQSIAPSVELQQQPSINSSTDLQQQFQQFTVNDHEDIEMMNISGSGGGSGGPLRRQPSYRKLSNSPIPPVHQRAMSFKRSRKNSFLLDNRDSPYSSFEKSHEDVTS